MPTAGVYLMDFKPKRLKQLMNECGISQTELVEVTGYKRPTINLVVNREDYFPARDPSGFMASVADYLGNNPRVREWLNRRGLNLADIWEVPEDGPEMRNRQPAGHGMRVHAGRQRNKQDGLVEEVEDMQAEKLTDETRRHFKIFRDPFSNDVRSQDDVFLPKEQEGVLADMLDTARHGGFIAVVGEVGSGKSTLRKLLQELLQRDGDTLTIFPQMIDKGRLTAAAICDAIIHDISKEKPKIKLEDKTRQVTRLLTNCSQGNARCVLVVEEAHDLSIATLKYLKRFYELEDGFRKLLGIILIGQTELKKDKLNWATGYGLREVISRCQVREIPALNGDTNAYIEKKFKRVQSDYKAVFDQKALEALRIRLLRDDGKKGGKKQSIAYPLLINNICIRAMNQAAMLGAPKVTDEIVYAL